MKQWQQLQFENNQNKKQRINIDIGCIFDYRNHCNSCSRAFYQSKPFLISAQLHCSLVNPISISFTILAQLIAGLAYFFTQSRACSSNNFRFPLYSVATTASCGSLGSGAHNRACKDNNAVRIVRAGDHQSLRISKQMAPVCDEIFGCHILVSNFIFGGLQGYQGGNWMSI